MVDGVLGGLLPDLDQGLSELLDSLRGEKLVKKSHKRSGRKKMLVPSTYKSIPVWDLLVDSP